MATEENLCFLNTDDPYATYGPGESIHGTATLNVPSPLLTKYIIVSLLAGCRIKSVGAGPTKQNFFHKQFTVLFHNKREDPNRKLSAGKHEWKFDFTMPASNELPPSFEHYDLSGSAEIVYCLVMCVFRINPTGPCTKDGICTLTIKYLPKRSPLVSIGASAAQLCQPLLVTWQNDGDVVGERRKRMPRSLKQLLNMGKLVEGVFHVTLWLPRFAALSEHMDISVKVQPATEHPSHVPDINFVKVEYRLWALTRIEHDQTWHTHHHQVQELCWMSTSVVDVNNHWVSLRRHAPFRIQPRLQIARVDKDSFTSLVPSFGVQNIYREYSLDVDVYLSFGGKIHRARFEKNELVLLPFDLHLDDNSR